MGDKNKGVVVLGGRCCDVKATAKRNAEEMLSGGKEKTQKLEKNYKSYSDLLA